MLKIRQYIKAETMEQAYELNQKKNNIILGGMLWLKMSDRNVDTVIDISGLGLDYIKEEDGIIKIGAKTSLRSVETSEILNKYTNGAMKEALSHIVGVQFRNSATMGGSIFGRYGFSDVLTIFMAMKASVRLYKAGVVDMETFAGMKPDNDILVEILVPVTDINIAYNSVRNSHSDFPVLTCAVARMGDEYRISIGARPGRAVIYKGNNPDVILKEIDQTIETQGNYRASAKYRHSLAAILAQKGLEQTGGNV